MGVLVDKPIDTKASTALYVTGPEDDASKLATASTTVSSTVLPEVARNKFVNLSVYLT